MREKRHEAGVDAVATAQLLQALLAELHDDGVGALEAITSEPLLSSMVAEALPRGSFEPVSRYASLLEGRLALREYSQRLMMALADTSLTAAEAEALRTFRADRGLTPGQVRALHAQAFAAAIVMFCQDGQIDAEEAAYLGRLRQALSDAGWCPGDRAWPEHAAYA